jgi:hypothetical protein
MMKKLKQSPILATVAVLFTVVLTLIAYASTVLSLPESWGEFSGVVSWITDPLSDGERDKVGSGLAAAGFMLLVVGLLLIYRGVRGRKLAEEVQTGISELGGLGIAGSQEQALKLLLERRFGLKEPREARSWKPILGSAVSLIAVGLAMVLLAPREFDPPRPPSDPKIAIGGSRVAGRAEAAGGKGGRRDGRDNGSPASAGGSGSGEEQHVLGVHTETPSSEAGKSPAGSPCTCSSSPGGSGEAGGPVVAAPPPEPEEVDPEPEEPEPEEPEPEEPEPEEPEPEESDPETEAIEREITEAEESIGP